jgi:hypothetical protein
MDLTTFNNLAIDSPKDAVDFMNMLIKILPNEPNKSKAILGVYDAFNEKIKNHEKAFAASFHNFFLRHQISKDNSMYHDKFSQYWSESKKEEVKKNNPHWTFSKTIFKSTYELVKALSKYNNDSFKNVEKFVNGNKSEISRIISNNKENFNKHMLEEKGWEKLFQSNYDFFHDFCIEYDFNENKVIKSLVSQDEYKKFEKIIKNSTTDPKTIDFIVDNLKKICGKGFFSLETDEDEQSNIVDAFLIFVMQNKTELAYKLYKENKKELNNCLYEFMYSYGYSLEIEKANVKDNKTWTELIELLERVNDYSHSAFQQLGFAIKPFQEVIKILETIPKIIDYEEMRSSLNNQPILKKNKKAKI